MCYVPVAGDRAEGKRLPTRCCLEPYTAGGIWTPGFGRRLLFGAEGTRGVWG